MTRLLYLLLAVLLAAVGQSWLSRGADDITARDALILFVLAGALFAVHSRPPEPWPELPPRRKWMYIGIGMSGLAVLLVLIALTRFWQDVYDGWALWVWLAAIPLFVAGTWLDLPSPNPQAEARAAQTWLAPHFSRRTVILLLVLILAVAAFARFYALDTYPNGCQSDECNNGLDALKWLSGAPYVPYAETNEGQATLFTYLIALFFRLFGPDVATMRAVSALAGTLTVLAVYFLARELLGQRLALLTAALVAGDRWHITFSRIVYELILMPPVLALQMLFLVKALKTGRRRWWGLAGLMLALGMNTYTAYRVVPIFTAVYLLYWLLTHRQRVLRDLEGMVVFGAGAFVGIAPLGVYIIRHWSVFLSRINHISVFRDVEAVGSYEPLWSNLRKTLYMFNWRGDVAALNNLPGAALLHAVVGVFLVLGVVWALRWCWREQTFLYLLWFGAVASVAVLSVAHEAPTARRPIGLIPVIYLLVASVWQQIGWAWEEAWGRQRWRSLAAVLTGLTVFVMAANIHTYFRVQAVHPDVWAAYSPNESAVGKYLATLPPDVRVYMTPQYTHHSAVRFIGGRRDITLLQLAEHVPLRQDPGGDVEYILEPVDERLVPLLEQLYPGGFYQAHRDRFGRVLFLSYRVPREALDAARGLQTRYRSETGPEVPGPQVARIDFDYRQNPPPLSPPFTVTYEGALLVPGYGEYTFVLEAAGGEAVLAFDGREQVRADEERAQVTRTLPGGFHELRVTFTTRTEPQRLRLSWSTPGQTEATVIPAELFYTLPGAANGLVGYYYATPDWTGLPTLIQRDLFILPNNSLREPFSIRWVGKVAAPVSGLYVFGTRSDDGSLVYINGRLVVDNGGQHGSQYREGTIELSEGFHDIEVFYNELGGSRDMQLWWQPPGGVRTIIPSAYLYPVEEALPEGLTLPPPPLLEPPLVEVSPETGEVVSPPAPTTPAAPAPPTGPAVTRPLGDFPVVEPTVVWTFGVCGSGREELQKPIGVAADAEGSIYVADMVGKRVVKLDRDGRFVTAWGEAGEGPGRFTEPFDLAVTPDGAVAVLDAVNQVVSLWSSDGRFLRELGAEWTTYRPRGLDVAANGDYWIADTGGVRVLQADAEGRLIRQIGGPEDELGPGQPTDVALSPGGLLFVVEPIAALLWKVDPEGGRRERFAGPQANTIESPHLAIAADGRVVLTDPEGGRVLVLTPDARPLAQFGTRGTEPGQFGRPVGVALTADGAIVVSDPDLCRVTMVSGW
ncbi:MAG: PA14 domain-containing protein [Caldilineales bacterium]|nr:PA14 domain-containing protein [Caldilineales bacterium]